MPILLLNSTIAAHNVKIPGWNSNGMNIKNTLPDYIYEHSDDYAHQIHPVGGPSVGINESGGYVIVYASPICKQVCFDLGAALAVLGLGALLQ